MGSYQSCCIRMDRERRPKMWVVGIKRLLLATRQCRRRDLMPLDWAAPEVILGLKCALSAVLRWTEGACRHLQDMLPPAPWLC